MLPPLQYKKVSQGMLGLRTIGLNIAFGDIGRMWSHANVSGGTTINSISGGTASSSSLWSNPQLITEYLTPSALLTMPKEISLPWQEIVGHSNTASTISSQTVSLSLGGVQLTAVPKMVLLFAKQPDSAETWNTPDAFFGCRSVSITFDNKVGILSTCPASSLWEISQRNGIAKSWLDWYGVANTTSGLTTSSTSSKLYTTGSVLALEFGTDIPLTDGLAAGVGGSFQFSVSGVWDVLGLATNSTLSAQLTAVLIYEGGITIGGGSAHTNGGMLARDSVVAVADASPSVPYDGASAHGAGFLSGVADFVKKHADKVKGAVELGKKAYDLYQGGASSGGAVSGGGLMYAKGDKGNVGGKIGLARRLR